jgi:hypothetical protein
MNYGAEPINQFFNEESSMNILMEFLYKSVELSKLSLSMK